jgi:hypothetical protein
VEAASPGCTKDAQFTVACPAPEWCLKAPRPEKTKEDTKAYPKVHNALKDHDRNMEGTEAIQVAVHLL